MNRDEIHRDTQARLLWITVGDKVAPRPEAEMRAIIEWIQQAVDAWLLDPGGFEGTMLLAMFEGMFTIKGITDGEPDFQLTEYGRARVDSMPHTDGQITEGGITGAPKPSERL